MLCYTCFLYREKMEFRINYQGYDNYLFSLFHNLLLIVRYITGSNYGSGCRQFNKLNDRLGVIERSGCRRRFRGDGGSNRRHWFFHHRTWRGDRDRRLRRFCNNWCSA